jgi:3-phenylpropionate/trans-cinnamate dioxygenase ferredoxin subunit
MSRHVVGRVSELPAGARKIVEAEGRSIGIFNVNGAFYALRNRCPHQGAPLCRGSVKGMTLPSLPGEYVWAREGEILRCPWHGWEFDLLTGEAICDPEGTRVRQYEVTVERADSPKEADGAAVSTDGPPAAETYPVRVEEEMIVLYL